MKKISKLNLLFNSSITYISVEGYPSLIKYQTFKIDGIESRLWRVLGKDGFYSPVSVEEIYKLEKILGEWENINVFRNYGLLYSRELSHKEIMPFKERILPAVFMGFWAAFGVYNYDNFLAVLAVVFLIFGSLKFHKRFNKLKKEHKENNIRRLINLK